MLKYYTTILIPPVLSFGIKSTLRLFIQQRQGAVDSWLEDVDDSGERQDWGWQQDCDAERFFDEYLVPNIRRRYGKVK